MKRMLLFFGALFVALSVTTVAEARGPYVYGYWNDFAPYPTVYPYYPNYTTGNVPYTPYGPYGGVIAPPEAFGFGPYFRYW